ncbi:hypothetical protein D6745_01190 [Candidatus Woesearchaeota archaeon]|nr:MAG: hypothetical protein D6745_01190 [Candidatus Woesearchaeota archaeon]
MSESEFERKVKEAMDNVVRTHQHDHPLYQETRIHHQIIDSENERAAFVLFEQIDTDRCTPEGEGWLGDQYRYSVWYVEGNNAPRMIYEDHAWIRNSVSALTGSRGRDASISLCELLEDGVIAEITPEGAEGGTFAKTKVKITLDGRIEEPKDLDFVEQAENLVKRIAPRLGYDYVRDVKRLPGRNVAAIVFGTENGSTYGFDTVYLVWENKDGELMHEVITDSKVTKDYLSIGGLREEGGKIIINVGGETYMREIEELLG